MDSFSKQADECASEGSLGKEWLFFFFLFAYWLKFKHLNKLIIRHQFKFFIHYNVNVSHTTQPFQSLKNPTHFSVDLKERCHF